MEDQKRRQVEYHEREHYRTGRPRQADNSNPLIASLNTYRLRKMVDMIGTSLDGKSVLSVSGGDGDEADFLRCQGALVTMTDLSTVAVEAARIRNPAIRSMKMDSETLAFADGSFDWAIVRDGLHHLARPLKGLYELEFGENWDPAGGYTYRFTRRELQKLFDSVQTVSHWQIHTNWLPPGSDAVKHFSVVMDVANPVMNQSFMLPVLCSRMGRAVLKSLFNSGNFLTGRWGNSLIVVAWKKPLQ
jgi:hypothetical protein